MECMYVKDCSSTIVLQLSRPELHHREQHRNRRPEDQRKNRRAAREQQKSNSRTAVKKQRDSSSFNFVLRCARQHRRHRCTWLVTPNVQMMRVIAYVPREQAQQQRQQQQQHHRQQQQLQGHSSIAATTQTNTETTLLTQR